MAGETVFLEVNYSSSDEDSCAGNIIKELDRPKLPLQKLDITKHPPLPLIIFKGLGLRSECVKTINGGKIPSIANNLSPEKGSSDSLQDILYTRRLAKWFVARSYKEAVSRYPKAQFQLGTLGYDEQFTISDTLIYKSSTFDFAKKSSRNPGQMNFSVTPELTTGDVIDDTQFRKSALTFDSNFESGNLFKAAIVTGREKLMTPNTIKYLQSSPGSFSVPENVDQEYDLTLSNDINTSGNIQWYYFSASSEDMMEDSITSRKSLYPLRVRFNIINMQKNDALYNFGMKPATFVSTSVKDDWRHSGEDVCYYKHWTQPSEDMSNNEEKKKKNERLYVLTFTYTFLSPCKVYFAHSFPYTYSDLKKYLGFLEENPRISGIMDRKELCTSIAGNVCECITITNKVNEMNCPGPLKPAIIISSRIHPGESNSSYIMNGVIDFLVSENFEAKMLRDNFVFKLVPMLNPDGVVHGNYRCSLIGTDLNRRYLNAHPSLYPTVFAMKKLLSDCQKKRGVLLFLDLHGHSKKKNSFLYGCDCTLQSEKLNSVAMKTYTNDEINMNKIYARTFAKVLCTLSDVKKGGYFSYRDSSFNVKNSKRGTGRVVSWRDLQIPGTFTIESSFCGFGNNDEKKILKHYEDPNQFSDVPIQNESIDSNDNYKTYNISRFLSPTKRSIDHKNVRNQFINEHNNQSLFRSCSSYELNHYHENKNENEFHSFASEKTNDDIHSALPLLNEVNPLSPSYNGFRKRSNSLSLHSLTSTLAAFARKNSNDKSGSDRSRKRSSTFRDTGNPLFEKLMKSYETATHYTKQDFKNIGKDIVRGIFCFSNLNAGSAVPSVRHQNLSPSKSKRKPSLYRSGSIQHNITNIIENNVRADLESDHREESGQERIPFIRFLEENERKRDDFDSSSNLIEDHDIGRQRGRNIGQNDIDKNGEAELKNEFKSDFLHPNYVNSTMLIQPLKKPSVYTVDAIQNAQSHYSSIMQNPKDFTFLRMKCEILIRQSLKIECPTGLGIDDTFIDEIDDREQCGGDDGSDSEPSIDNIPTSKILGKKNISTFKDSKSLMRALQKAAKKRNKALDKAALKLGKKLAKELSEVSNSLVTREIIPSSASASSGSGPGTVYGSRSAMGAAIQEKNIKTSGTEDISLGLKSSAEHGFKRNEMSERLSKLSLENSNIVPEQSHARSFNVSKQGSDYHRTASARNILSGRLPRMSIQRSNETKTSDQIDNNDNNNNDNSRNNNSNNNHNVEALIRPKSEVRIIKNNPLTLILPYDQSSSSGYGRDNGGHKGYGGRESPRGKRKSSHLRAFGPADSFIKHCPISQDFSDTSTATLINKNIFKNGFSSSLYRP